MSVVAFVNPLTIGLSNVFMPRAVLAYAEGGGQRLLRETVRNSLLLGASMGLFCVLVAFAGGDVVGLLYHGPEYQSRGLEVTLLTLSWLPFALGLPACIGLAAMERPRPIVWAGIGSVLVTMGLVYALSGRWGLVGAACAVIAGSSVEAAARWLAFLAHIARPNTATKNAEARAA